MRDLTRLFQPATIAVIGGGAWCSSVVEQCIKMGYSGPVWPVHPNRAEIAGVAAVPSLADLPGVPDAVFIGVNRTATIDIVRELRDMGAGGAICFASGFQEAQAETGDGSTLQAALLDAAGDMPIIGPNCYGFINYLDGALLWPDQHGGQRCDRGVAILTQSSNMAINLTMQARGLPLAYITTAGNQAQTGLAQIGEALLADDRVTALGMHIEGIGDLRAFEALAKTAQSRGKPVIALKAGKSAQAQAAAVSHTASLTGSDAGAHALLRRLGIARVNTLTEFLETLKLLHFAGPLPSNRIVSMSCSGGEASLMADAAVGRDITFPPLTEPQHHDLRAALGPMVALANPLDYHTFIWNDGARMGQTFAAMMQADIALGCLIVDFPRVDRCDASAWDCVIEAGRHAVQATGRNLALVATLPEALSEDVSNRAIAAGLIPMHGLDDTLSAIEAAATLGQNRAEAQPVLEPGSDNDLTHILNEAEAKAGLSAYGLSIPNARIVQTSEAAAEAAAELGLPLVLKGTGAAHKTEAGLVALSLMTPLAVREAARRMGCNAYLIEEMITDSIAELLIGVVRDPAHGFVLTLAAGGVLTEILKDSTSRLLPVNAADITQALDELQITPLLRGYRGKSGVDISAIVQAVLAVQDYVLANRCTLEEIEINPLICTPDRAVAADALIRLGT